MQVQVTTQINNIMASTGESSMNVGEGDDMKVDGKDESRLMTDRAPLPRHPWAPSRTPLPIHLLLLLTHIISLCESVSKCSMQFKRFCQFIEDKRYVNSFRQLRSCHKRCVVLDPKHLYDIIKLCKEEVFSVDNFVAFASTMESMVREDYFLEGPEVKFLRSQFHFVYGLIKRARFEMAILIRFHFVIIGLLDTPKERDSQAWNHAVAFFPYVLELAQTRWKVIASNINVELDVHCFLPTLFVSTSMEHLQHKFLHMIEREPKAYVRGGDEDFSTDSSCSDSDSDCSTGEQRKGMIYDMKSQLKMEGPVSEESASDDDAL